MMLEYANDPLIFFLFFFSFSFVAHALTV